MSRNFNVVLRTPHPQQELLLSCMAMRIVVCAGRRFGKTHFAAILAVLRFLSGKRVLYAAPTAEQLGIFWNEVKRALAPLVNAGILSKNETEHIIEFPGTEQRIRAKTAWNADMLRGDYADLLILDEFQLMNESIWEEVGLPMLLDHNGRAVILFTPASLRSRSVSKANDPRHASKLFAAAQKDTSGRSAAFHFTSHDNPLIPREALAAIETEMSRLVFRQEIKAEDISEVPGALWNPALIERARVTEHPPLVRIVVAIDPSVSSGESSNEAGIIVAGVDEKGHGYLLADLSRRDSPQGWALECIRAYHKWGADRIVGEINNGGEMVELTLRTIDADISYKAVHATHGKTSRAEPICALSEQGRIHHVGRFEPLEEEMCSYIPGGPSPNRMDAMVWSFTELMLERAPRAGIEVWS